MNNFINSSNLIEKISKLYRDKLKFISENENKRLSILDDLDNPDISLKDYYNLNTKLKYYDTILSAMRSEADGVDQAREIILNNYIK